MKDTPRVTYRQEDGDDGYSYVVRMNGREMYSGLTQSEARYYKKVIESDYDKMGNRKSEKN